MDSSVVTFITLLTLFTILLIYSSRLPASKMKNDDLYSSC